MGYPEAINLPFNRYLLDKKFIPGTPDKDDGLTAGFWVILQAGGMVVRQEGERLLLPEGERPDWLEEATEVLYIGSWLGRPLRVASVGRTVMLPEGWLAEPFNAVQERLDDDIMTLGGIANQILNWERNSRLCSRCGDQTVRVTGTWGKKCPDCGYEHYPHIHPCIIVLVRRGDEFLLTRKAEWAKGRYSLVAGFLDFGESMEECVVREVREETGIEVKNIRYVGSQSWPFPSQLMAGFVADYAGGDIVVDHNELEDARWFCLQDLPESLPTHRSIARWIIERFALIQ